MNFVGDFLTSMVKPLIDVFYSLCFFLSGEFFRPLAEISSSDTCSIGASTGWFSTVVVPIIILGPYWLRLMQCLRRYVDSGKRHPHLPNAFKYALSMVVTVFGVFQKDLSGQNNWTPYQIIWRLAYLSSTIYSWNWDVRKDWSLVDRTTGRLRPRRMVAGGDTWPYYSAAAADLVLRFAWAYTLIPDQNQGALGVGLGMAMAPVTAALEILRRTMWSVFRLENEHLHNTEGYRATDAIPLHYDVSRRPKGLAGAKAGSRRRLILFEVSAYAAVVIAISVFAIVNKDLDSQYHT